MGKATIREHRYPHIVRANTCMCEKIIPPTKPSPRGEGGERSEPDRVLATRKISGKIVSSRQFTRAPKEANPASLRSAAPSKGRGSRGHSLLPMEGGAPKGRRLDGGSGMKKIEGRSSQVRRLREHPSAADAVPLPQRGRLRYEDVAFLASSKRIQDTWRKRITTDKAFPSRGRWRAERAG